MKTISSTGFILLIALFCFCLGLAIGYYSGSQSMEPTNERTEFNITVGPLSNFYKNILHHKIIQEIEPDKALEYLKGSYAETIKEEYEKYKGFCSELTNPKFIARCQETVLDAHKIITEKTNS